MMSNKSNLRVLASVALAAIGAAVSHAQAFGYGYGYGFASATFYASSGTYLTGSTSQYGLYLEGPYTTGLAGYADYQGTYEGGITVYGAGDALAVPGGSSSFAIAESVESFTFTNETDATTDLYVWGYTYGYGEAYSNSWNAAGIGAGEGEISDSLGQMLQFSEAQANVLGFGDGGSVSEYWNYSSLNGEFDGVTFFGNQFPYATSAGVTNYIGYYDIVLQAGQSDTFTLTTLDGHEAIASTPGPVAVAPFTLGLIGALRRRKKA